MQPRKSGLVRGKLRGAPSSAEGHLQLGAGYDASCDQCGRGPFVRQLYGLIREDFEILREAAPVAEEREVGAALCGVDRALLNRRFFLQHSEGRELVLDIAKGGENLFAIERGRVPLWANAEVDPDLSCEASVE